MNARAKRNFPRARAAAFATACLGSISTAVAASPQSPPAPTAVGVTWPVTNCNERGPGSLRAAVAKAASGDRIDLTQVGCRRIELDGIPIVIPQNALRIVGPGRKKMTIDGNDRSSIFRHTGTSRLWISGISFEDGQHRPRAGDDRAEGGCIYSAGRVRLDWSSVHHCTAYGGEFVRGGGIAAYAGATVNHSSIYSNEAFGGCCAAGGGIWGGGSGITRVNFSQVFENTAYSSTSNISEGGGVSASNLAMNYAMLADNYAGTVGDRGGRGGGAHIILIAVIRNSTIAGNIAESSEGGVSAVEVALTNSTVSGNRARHAAALGAIDLSIVYSTIAFNNGFSDACADSAAVVQDFRVGVLDFFSSILANNTCKGLPAYDVWSKSGAIQGGANIVMASRSFLPQDTIRTDPMLGPLADNGGIGLTHALKVGSLAIDSGSNDLSEIPRWDQRGRGFPRVKGTDPDIGAYEY